MSDKREQAIKTLEDIIAIAESLKGLSEQYGGITITLDKISDLKFALESIKVDRAYDLAYEKVDFIEIPDNATNGDMIKAMFPQFEVFIMGDNQQVTILCGEMRMDFSKDWWNSPYRKENNNG